MKYLMKYMKQYRIESFLAPAFKMLEAVFDLLVPYIIADAISAGVAQRDASYIYKKALLLILMAFFGFLCSTLAQYFSARVASEAAAGLRHDVFEKVQSLSYKEIDEISPSTLITRMSSDINLVQNGINLFLRLFMRSPFIVFGALFMAFRINAGISLIFLAVIAILFAVVFIIFKVTTPLYSTSQNKLDVLTVKTRENLLGVRVVRAFSKEESEVREFKNASEDVYQSQMKAGNISALSNPLTYTITNLGIVAVIWFGAEMVDMGSLLSGSVIALINYLNQILVELVKLANLIITISRALASLRRIEDVLNTESSMDFGEEEREESERAVVFDHVFYKYHQNGQEALYDISFEVKKKETVGIIGSTGSGKTTLIHLLSRYYDTTEGNILLFDKPIRDYSKDAVRDAVAIASQNVQLFTGTIRSNLQWGKKDATEEEMSEALKKAQAYDFVMNKENGLDSIVEQGGRNFSGGQRQRLSIARALVKKAPLLILDDSSSALDYQTDLYLRHALKEVDATVFIVSQRTSSIQHCDQILVLDDGRLVGKGKHEDLLENCAVYKEIYDSQYQRGDGK